MKVNGHHNCLIPDILQNIFFCVQQKKENHRGLEQLHGDSIITKYCVKYPFNVFKKSVYLYFSMLFDSDASICLCSPHTAAAGRRPIMDRL